jgi:hypothetical protein
VAIESRYGANGGRELDLVVAMASGEPVLFKGDDFARTDIAAVIYWSKASGQLDIRKSTCGVSRSFSAENVAWQFNLVDQTSPFRISISGSPNTYQLSCGSA